MRLFRTSFMRKQFSSTTIERANILSTANKCYLNQMRWVCNSQFNLTSLFVSFSHGLQQFPSSINDSFPPYNQLLSLWNPNLVQVRLVMINVIHEITCRQKLVFSFLMYHKNTVTTQELVRKRRFSSFG